MTTTKKKTRSAGEPLTGAEARAAFAAAIREQVAEALRLGTADDVQSGEDAEQVERQRIGELEAQIARLEEQMSQRTMSLPGSEETERGSEGYSFAAVARALAAGGTPDILASVCPREYEMHRNLQAREHGMIDDPSAGFLVPAEVYEQFFEELLLPRIIAFQLGIRQISVSGSPVLIPVLEERPSVDNVAENQGGTASNIKIGQMAMTPKSCQSEVNISRDLLRSAPGAEGLVRQLMADEMVRRLSAWIMTGAGGANEPVGVTNTAGIGSVDFSGVTINAGAVPADYYKLLLQMIGVVEDANALVDSGSFGWAMPTKAKRAAMLLQSEATTAAHLAFARTMITDSDPSNMLGYRYLTSNQLASGAETEVIFGDWSKVVFAQWGGIRIEASNVAGTAFSKNQTVIIARTSGDVAVTQPAALAVSSGLDLSSLDS